MTSPAEHVIKKCGGAAEVAKLTKVHVSGVYRWTHSKDVGGTGGHIPAKHQKTLLEVAREKGIDLSPADFFEGEA